MLKQVLRGAVAGAVGTMALDAITYADMALRSRPASEAPTQLVTTLADQAGIDLATGTSDEAKKEQENRASGLGALVGYLNGVGVGVVYGLLRPHLRRIPKPLVGLALGVVAMAASDIPLALTGVSDPATWEPTDWVADIVPHLAYGLLTALTFDAFPD